MATGVPKKGHSSNNGVKPRLSYEGKTPTSDILATPPAELTCLRRSPSAHDNRLYFGDNLPILARLLRDRTVRGHVRLIYIDPPFSTQSHFVSRKQKHAYEDTLAGADYVEFLRKRLVLLHELLATDGSLYLHLDENMMFHMKVILDEVFGTENYHNCIVRKKCNSKNYTRKTYGNIADYVLFYTKSPRYVWNKPHEPWTAQRAKEYQYIDPERGRRYMKVPIHAPGIRNGETGKPWRGMLPPPGKHWQFPPSTLDEMDARGDIYWSPTGNPRRKVYLDDSPGVGVQDIWLEFRDAHNQNIRITGYPTEKNPELLHRIIAASSNPGDLVLDCFAGSGTTMAVAHQLGRRWVGIDNSIEAIKTALFRFTEGTELMGDYVSERRPAHRATQSQPSLFESLEPSPGGQSVPQHVPVTQFAIFAPRLEAEQLGSVLRQWQQTLLRQAGTDSEGPHVSIKLEPDTPEIYLAAQDPAIGRLIHQFGPCTLRHKEGKFWHLVEAILGQQLSMTAARTICGRIRTLFGRNELDAKNLLSIPTSRLRDAGVSARKTDSLRDLAKQIEESKLDLSALNDASDQEVITRLTQVKGIGPWTAEMFLLFSLARQDIFPLHDNALRTIMAEVYGISPDSDEQILATAVRWRPYRSIACWYLYMRKNSGTPHESSHSDTIQQTNSSLQLAPIGH
jgi:adenine-specific DNA-methyltransferase